MCASIYFSFIITTILFLYLIFNVIYFINNYQDFAIGNLNYSLIITLSFNSILLFLIPSIMDNNCGRYYKLINSNIFILSGGGAIINIIFYRSLNENKLSALMDKNNVLHFYLINCLFFIVCMTFVSIYNIFKKTRHISSNYTIIEPTVKILKIKNVDPEDYNKYKYFDYDYEDSDYDLNDVFI